MSTVVGLNTMDLDSCNLKSILIAPKSTDGLGCEELSHSEILVKTDKHCSCLHMGCGLVQEHSVLFCLNPIHCAIAEHPFV